MKDVIYSIFGFLIPNNFRRESDEEYYTIWGYCNKFNKLCVNRMKAGEKAHNICKKKYIKIKYVYISHYGGEIGSYPSSIIEEVLNL